MNQLKRVSARRAELLHSLEELTPAGIDSSLREQIVGALRRAIELGTLKPGDRLVEKDLCDRFDVSRTSLREALRDLEAHGVVTKLTARTMVITSLSREDVLNISRVRAAIEMMLAEQFIKCATEADIAALGAALERLRALDPNTVASLDANREYYEIWCKGAGNMFAFTLLMNIQLRLAVIRSTGLRIPELRERMLENREAILDCMARRDVVQAQEMVRRYNRDATLAVMQAEETPERQTHARHRFKAVK